MKPLTDYLRPDQAAILANPAQVKVVSAGRRFGKTFMCGLYILEIAQQGAACAWVSPIYRTSRPLWRFCEAIVNPQIATVHKAEREIEFPGGGRIGIYSADNDVSIRGEAFDLVVVDEAAQCKEETFTDVLMPTLADRNGRIILISTPKGRNWFAHEWQKAHSIGAAWQAPSSANPSPNIKRAYELARTRVSARTFKQEWDALFVDDGSFFQNVRQAATAQPLEQGEANHNYVIGVDWARVSGGDWTVYSVIDSGTHRQVAQVRQNGAAFDMQRARLAELHHRFNDANIIAESNTFGIAQIESLQMAGLPVTAFDTSRASKHQIISALELALENHSIELSQDEILINEMESYEIISHSDGIPSYSAPAGLHDDCVMALALAWHGAANTGESFVLKAR